MFDLSFWQQRANRQTFIDTALIGGHPVKASSGATFDAINPATNQLLAQVAGDGLAQRTAGTDEQDLHGGYPFSPGL